ncbi:MAG TPA: glucose-6-phosphate dehydrogenase, partial [Anaerolineales bacterium]|nr:glucose-6-phosphate dehydrogenase [Anaerolineales bacterium]
MSDDLRTTIVIFGASGDLTQRKLIPSLFNVFRKKRLGANLGIVGHSKTPFTDDEFRKHLWDGLQLHATFAYKREEWDDFVTHIAYHTGGYDSASDFESLDTYVRKADGGTGNRLYYLATPPDLFPRIIEHLGQTGQLQENAGWRRIVVEKPFGTDLESAQRLNEEVHAALRERQIYRIDHYLGKETVQNILVTRFANTIFEPLWNRNYIDHVQITVAEDVGVEHRAGYYDQVGVLGDIFQNHLLQLTCLVAMEPPAAFDATSLRNEKLKVLTSIHPLSPTGVASSTVRGQYQGYREEQGVDPKSETATFAAVRLLIENWRWQGVPFYLRSGKRLKEKFSHVAIQFKRPPHNLFRRSQSGIRPNVLILYLQPDEGIHWRFEAKVPDSAELRGVDMEFHYADSFEGTELPEAYDRLLLDAISGDASLFTRADEVEAAWTLIDPIAKTWKGENHPNLVTYEPGSWGPREADAILTDYGRAWFNGT